MKLSPRYDSPTFLSIDGRPDDQSAAVRRQRRRLESLLAELGDDEWHVQSRCDAWTVQDVVAHLVGVNAFWEASVSAGLAGKPTRLLETFDPAAHPPLIIEPMRALTPRATFDRFVASNDGFLGALAMLDDEGWSTPAESPAGHVPIRLLAHHALWDAWVHERDIAIPLGIAAAEDPNEITSCLRYAAAVGPVTSGDNRAFVGDLGVVADGPDVRFTLTIGDSVAVRDDPPVGETPCLRGSAVHLTEALSVRAPLPADAPAEWRRLVRSLAAVFDTEPEE